jgi:AAA domain
MTERLNQESAAYREVKASLDAWEMWVDLTEEQQLAIILRQFPAGDWLKADPHTENNLGTIAHFRSDEIQWEAIKQRYKEIGGNPRGLETAADAYLSRHRNGQKPSGESRYQKESLTNLIAAEIPPPLQLFDGLMHEGMLLFGGKSKRGKSWLMFDLAISLSVQRAGFRHFECPKARPVLYLALEDGRARLQGRAKAIQPNLTTVNGFDLMYNFPPLSEGGIDLLTEEIAQHHYGLVVIDVLAKLEKPSSKGDKNYHDIYEMFAPLQELRKRHPFCLAMLTHLRKQEADDVFDALLGSVAYQGAQDVLWVLERKPKDDFAFLHIRDKDAEDKVIALRFLDGHWEYVGEGDEYTVNRDQRKILKVLAEENREMGIEEIRKAAEFAETKYGYVRKLLVTMVKDDMIHHSSYGKYSATLRAVKEMQVDDYQTDERGDRVPF